MFEDDNDSMEKNEFIVKLPISGTIEITVNAIDETDAIERSLDVDITDSLMYDNIEIEIDYDQKIDVEEI